MNCRPLHLFATRKHSYGSPDRYADFSAAPLEPSARRRATRRALHGADERAHLLPPEQLDGELGVHRDDARGLLRLFFGFEQIE